MFVLSFEKKQWLIFSHPYAPAVEVNVIIDIPCATPTCATPTVMLHDRISLSTV